MKKQVLSQILFLTLLTSFASAAIADNLSKQQQPPENFEAIVKDNADQKLVSWTGKIFRVRDGKTVGNVSFDNRRASLPSGNYIILFQFTQEVPEMKGVRPFTFTVTKDHQTTLTLVIGASQGPEQEKGVLRTAKGEDYANFSLPVADPNLCKTKCKKDRNCGAYTYVDLGKQGARCYLIRGAGTPAPCKTCISEVIQRESFPYRVQITTEPLAQEE